MTTDFTTTDAKAMARRLRVALREQGEDPGHSGSLELIARALDARDWNTLAARHSEASAGDGGDIQRVVPLLHMIDWTSTRRFYVDFLGSTVDWVDDTGDHSPRYVGVTLATGAKLQLSEHNGDGTPGNSVLVPVADLDRQLANLVATGYGAPPAIEESRRGRSITVHDPTGNRIMFVSVVETGQRYPDELPPIVNEVALPVDPGAAFAQFTSFGWWHGYGLADDGHVSIDDGEVVFHNGSESSSIGRVLVWEPAARYEQTFTLAQDPDHPTTLTATFEAVREGTRVRVEHGGWNAANASRRGHFADWPLILSGLLQ